MLNISRNSSVPYDVCLLLEGTYPFVTGGVSTWVHNLIKALPEIRFTGVCILASAKEQMTVKYDIPDNFQDMQVVHIHDHELSKRGRARKQQRRQQIGLLNNFHQKMKQGDYSALRSVLSLFPSQPRTGLTTHDMIHGKEAWKLLLDFYNPSENRESFIDYFWTYRFTHLPLFKVLQTQIPHAQIYHTISTGYAGLLGAAAKYLHGNTLLLTEHGIYTKERRIEIANAEWIYEAAGEQIKMQKNLSAFQKLWVQLFEALGRIVYQEADRIFTLYEGNRQLEIVEGAQPDKIEVIPNGIALEKFRSLKPPPSPHTMDQPEVLQVGFVGRVVPIKDVKTFIRACKIVSLHLPGIRFYVLGPTEDDPAYYRECLELTHVLHLTRQLEFTGKIDVREYYRKLDLIVLTSISEAQPLVLLEGNCAGIPVVASDVGACRELLEGRTPEDKKLGPSGIATRVADPVGTAKGMISILSNPRLRAEMAQAGQKRVEQFYRESDLNRKYLAIYQEYMGRAAASN